MSENKETLYYIYNEDLKPVYIGNKIIEFIRYLFLILNEKALIFPITSIPI